MLLHLADLGQERETPVPLHLGEIAKESFQLLVEFIFYFMIFASIYLRSRIDQTWYVNLIFAVLACSRTFSKLKHLHNQSKEIKQGPSTTKWRLSLSLEAKQKMELNEEEATLYARYLFQTSHMFILSHHNHLDPTKSSYFWLSPRNASRIVEAELKLVYDKFFGGAVLSMFDIIISIPIYFIRIPPYYSLLLLAYYCFLHYNQQSTTTFLSSFHFGKKLKPFFLMENPDLVYLFNPLSATIMRMTHHFVLNPITTKEHNLHNCRWSRTIPRFNLLEYSFRKPSKLSVSVNYMLNTWSLSGMKQYNYEIGEFIFRKLGNMILKISKDDPTSKLHAARQIIAAEGQWVLKQENYQDLVDSEASFEESVLLWHVATTILYYTRRTPTSSYQIYHSLQVGLDNDQRPINSYMSILLSDYMGYLLIVQPWIMSKPRGSVLRRCLEMWATIYEITKNIGVQSYRSQGMLQRVCEEISKHQSTREDQTRNVLQSAFLLAQKLDSDISRCGKDVEFHSRSVAGEAGLCCCLLYSNQPYSWP